MSLEYIESQYQQDKWYFGSLFSILKENSQESNRQSMILTVWNSIYQLIPIKRSNAYIDIMDKYYKLKAEDMYFDDSSLKVLNRKEYRSAMKRIILRLTMFEIHNHLIKAELPTYPLILTLDELMYTSYMSKGFVTKSNTEHLSTMTSILGFDVNYIFENKGICYGSWVFYSMYGLSMKLPITIGCSDALMTKNIITMIYDTWSENDDNVTVKRLTVGVFGIFSNSQNAIVSYITDNMNSLIQDCTLSTDRIFFSKREKICMPSCILSMATNCVFSMQYDTREWTVNPKEDLILLNQGFKVLYLNERHSIDQQYSRHSARQSWNV